MNSLQSLNDIATELYRLRIAAIEKLLVETIESHLGRVPTNEEVAAKGMRYIHPDNIEHFYWGKHRLFSIFPADDKSFGSFKVLR